jgi:hypothetical protein
VKKAEKAQELDRQLAEYERMLRMPLTRRSVAQEDSVIPFTQITTEPQVSSASGDD